MTLQRVKARASFVTWTVTLPENEKVVQEVVLLRFDFGRYAGRSVSRPPPVGPAFWTGKLGPVRLASLPFGQPRAFLEPVEPVDQLRVRP